MTNALSPSAHSTHDQILQGAIGVFGRLGFKKATIDDLAAAANLSRQGLYLHFSGKQAIFTAALQRYLDDGLALVDAALTSPAAPLNTRLLDAIDHWFGRHLVTFTPASFDVMEAQRDLHLDESVETYKSAWRGRVAGALKASPEFQTSGNRCSPKEIAQVLFTCGLSWKERPVSRREFRAEMKLAVRACTQLPT